MRKPLDIHETDLEDATPVHGSILQMKKALKKCLEKPRQALNGGNLERKRSCGPWPPFNPAHAHVH